MSDHPDPDQGWLIRTVQHQSSLVPALTRFRPDPIPQPVIRRLHSAKVTAPEGETIFYDELMRIKVNFCWDLNNLDNDTSSP